MKLPGVAQLDLPVPAPAPSTDAPAHRVVWNVIGLLLLTCALRLANAVVVFGSLCGLPWSWSTRGLYIADWLQFSFAAIVFGWLLLLVMARTPLSRVSPRQRLIQRGAAVLSGAAALYSAAPFPSVLAQSLGQTVFACVAAWLALEVCWAHGVPLDIRFPRTAVARLRDWDITRLVFFTCVAGGGLTSLLLWLIHRTGMDTPVMKGSQMSALGIDDARVLPLTVLAAVAIEDVVIVATTTALLTAIRRPAWQIYALVCAIEVVLHAYFGLPAIGMLAFAAGRVWLYRQYGRLIPFMVAHFVFDLGSSAFPLFLARIPLLYGPVVVFPLVFATLWIDDFFRKAAHSDGGQSPLQPSAPVPAVPGGADSGGQPEPTHVP